MSYIDRTIKILSRLNPDWAKKTLSLFIKEIVSLEPVRLELNLPERRVDDAYEIVLKNGEKKYIFLEFLFGVDKRPFCDYFIKTAMANSVYGSGKAVTLVIQITEGKGTTLEPVFRTEIEGIKNEFRMQLFHLNEYITEIESGEYYEFAPLLPLLKASADKDVLNIVKRLIEKETDLKIRADLYSAAITIAGRYLNKDFLWDFFKEEIEMIKESEIVQDWIDEGMERGMEKGREEGREEGMERGREEGMERGIEKGIEKGELKRAGKVILEVLEARFDLVHKETISELKKIKEIEVLEILLKKAVVVESVKEFDKIIKKLDS